MSHVKVSGMEPPAVQFTSVVDDSKLRILTAARDKAEAAMVAAEAEVLPAQIACENAAHELAAMSWAGDLFSGQRPEGIDAGLLRKTRELEEGEAAVWDHHQQTVAAMRQAVVEAEQHAADCAEALRLAELGQRESIQACVLAERKATKDAATYEAAVEREHAARYTEERAEAEAEEKRAAVEAVESEAAYEGSKLSIMHKVRRQDDLEMKMGQVFQPDQCAPLGIDTPSPSHSLTQCCGGQGGGGACGVRAGDEGGGRCDPLHQDRQGADGAGG